MTPGEMLAFLGIAVTLVPVAVGGAVGLVLKISDRHTQREERAAQQDQERRKSLEERVADLETSDRAKTLKLRELEDKTRDQAELIDDAAPLVVWIQDGAHPPVPVVGWRWIRHLARSIHNDDTQAPPREGPSH